MERKWRDVIPDEDYEIYKESGFKGVQGVRLGLGERPALIIIDIQHRTVGLDKPTLESIRHSQKYIEFMSKLRNQWLHFKKFAQA